ncbi:unnamed protein product [Prorocentrum cordatum]|uniref:Uncharacterized protein n=1 Tax=Prorocentrum cordatum TaxID=2364126 RepID=A0ABN9TMA6_9DINO|nr:unnamed protein product [Polarella glacialis]
MAYASSPGSFVMICSGLAALVCVAAILFVSDFLQEQIESIQQNSTLVETCLARHTPVGVLLCSILVESRVSSTLFELAKLVALPLLKVAFTDLAAHVRGGVISCRGSHPLKVESILLPLRKQDARVLHELGQVIVGELMQVSLHVGVVNQHATQPRNSINIHALALVGGRLAGAKGAACPSVRTSRRPSADDCFKDTGHSAAGFVRRLAAAAALSRAVEAELWAQFPEATMKADVAAWTRCAVRGFWRRM